MPPLAFWNLAGAKNPMFSHLASDQLPDSRQPSPPMERLKKLSGEAVVIEHRHQPFSWFNARLYSIASSLSVYGEKRFLVGKLNHGHPTCSSPALAWPRPRDSTVGESPTLHSYKFSGHQLHEKNTNQRAAATGESFIRRFTVARGTNVESLAFWPHSLSDSRNFHHYIPLIRICSLRGYFSETKATTTAANVTKCRNYAIIAKLFYVFGYLLVKEPP